MWVRLSSANLNELRSVSPRSEDKAVVVYRSSARQLNPSPYRFFVS